MSEEFSLDIAISKEEMNKIKDLLTNAPGLRHYGVELKTGEYLDLVEYKDYKVLEQENQQLKEVIEEAKRYIKKHSVFISETGYGKIIGYPMESYNADELLQILDKVKE